MDLLIPHDDPLWSQNPCGAATDGFVATFAGMVQLALQGDWPAYLERAHIFGRLSPMRPPEPTPQDTPDDKSLVFDEMWRIHRTYGGHTIQRALLRCNAGEKDALLLGLRLVTPVQSFLALVDTMLASSCHGMSKEVDSETVIPHLLSAGANPSVPAAYLARCGRTDALMILLDHGLDPNTHPPGHMPLILEALCKDRMYGSSLKMECAKMLWDRGARLDTPFTDPSGPSCLLDFCVGPQNVAGSDPEHAHSSLWDRFCLPWNYIGDVGLPPEALLPPERNVQANARLADLRHGHPDAPNWIHLAREYAWFGSALELAELRMVPAAQADPRRKAI